MNKKQLLLPMLACFLPVLAGVLLYEVLPEQLPIHWNSAGEIDDYGHKAAVLFGFPVFFMLMEAVLYGALTTDPKKMNQSQKLKSLSLWLLPVTEVIVLFLTITSVLEYEVNVVSMICLFMGALFVIVGNYLPKCKQNYTMGYRIPWALQDTDNWNKTHRLAGYLWMLEGVVLIIVTLLVREALVLAGVMAVLIILFVVPVIYSYCLYKRKNNTCD